ncbi:hypothetical protein GCM10027615_25490 [Plantactinospora veratri]
MAALLPIAGAYRLRSTAFGVGAAVVLVVVLAITLVRAAAETSWPLLGSAAGIVVLLAAAITGTARLLPAGIRVGPRAGGLVVAGALAVLTGSMALVVAVASALRSQPAWRADLAARSGPFDWQLPVALVLAAAALVLLGRRRDRSLVLLAGLVCTVLAAPAAFALPWWLVAVLDLVLAGALALAAGWPGRPPRAAVPMALAAVPLAGHAVLVGLARPAGAAAVCGALVLLGVAVALTALRPATAADPEPEEAATTAVPGLRRVVGGGGLATAVLAAPATVLLALFAAGVSPGWQARAVLAAAVLLAAGLVPVRRAVPHYQPYANAALATVALAVGLAPGLPGVDEPAGPYAAGALLLNLGVWLSGRGRPAGTAERRTEAVPAAVPALVSGAILLLRAAMVAVPAVLAVLVTPYGWLGRIWSGPPAGVGLYPTGLGVDPAGWRLDGAGTLTLLLLTGAAAVAGWARWRSVPATALVAGPFAVGTALVGLVAAGAPWPAVPASSLLAGVAGALVVALRRDLGRRVWLLPVAVAFGAAGLAGLLPTRSSTLAGLALVGAAGVTAGALGRTSAARVAGWLTGVGGAAALTGTATVAADLPLRITALAVLGVAALALAGSALLAGSIPREGVRGPAGSGGAGPPGRGGRRRGGQPCDRRDRAAADRRRDPVRGGGLHALGCGAGPACPASGRAGGAPLGAGGSGGWRRTGRRLAAARLRPGGAGRGVHPAGGGARVAGRLAGAAGLADPDQLGGVRPGARCRPAAEPGLGPRRRRPAVAAAAARCRCPAGGAGRCPVAAAGAGALRRCRPRRTGAAGDGRRVGPAAPVDLPGRRWFRPDRPRHDVRAAAPRPAPAACGRQPDELTCAPGRPERWC